MFALMQTCFVVVLASSMTGIAFIRHFDKQFSPLNRIDERSIRIYQAG